KVSHFLEITRHRRQNVYLDRANFMAQRSRYFAERTLAVTEIEQLVQVAQPRMATEADTMFLNPVQRIQLHGETLHLAHAQLFALWTQSDIRVRLYPFQERAHGRCTDMNPSSSRSLQIWYTCSSEMGCSSWLKARAI